MTDEADLAAARTALETLRARSPGAARLACCVSLAARVEPELLRAARLELLPDTEPGAEADVWLSDLVEAANPVALVFEPAAATVLREELAQDQEMLDRAWRVVDRVHRDAPPALRLEEEVTWLSLSTRPDARARVDGLLERVLRALVDEERLGLAHWAARALPRLPQRARESRTAWMLAVSAGTRLGGRAILPGALPADAEAWLPYLLPDRAPHVEVGVRLLEGGVEVGGPPGDDHVLEVPQGLPLEVSAERRESLVPDPARPRVLNVGHGPVRIRTALGEEFELLPRESGPVESTVFTLEAFGGGKGESLILHYGEAGDSELILIDGGPPGAYRTLRGRLDQIREAREPNRPLKIRLAIVTHGDEDRLRGMLDLTQDLLESRRSNRRPDYHLTELWCNPVSRQSMQRLLHDAQELGMVVNPGFPGEYIRAGMRPLVGDLALNVIGPSEEQLEALRRWDARNEGEASDDFSGSTGLESGSSGSGSSGFGGGYNGFGGGSGGSSGSSGSSGFGSGSGGGRSRRPGGSGGSSGSGGESGGGRSGGTGGSGGSSGSGGVYGHAYTDASASNLASIVVLVEMQGRRMLLTGDARGDHVLQQLEKQGFMTDGRIHVDLLKVPHYGSEHNVSPEFFERVTADHYVISVHDRYGLPREDTLRMMAEARDGEPFTLYLTSHAPHLSKFLDSHASRWGYTVVYPGPGEPSVVIDLLAPLPDRPQGGPDRKKKAPRR